jgi:hypothetical protein
MATKQHHAFEPEAVQEMTDAYKKAVRTLQFTQRYDGTTAVIAKKIIEAAQLGVRGADALCERTLKDLDLRGKGKPWGAGSPWGRRSFETRRSKRTRAHSSSSNALTRFKSCASKPSVNQP